MDFFSVSESKNLVSRCPASTGINITGKTPEFSISLCSHSGVAPYFSILSDVAANSGEEVQVTSDRFGSQSGYTKLSKIY